MEWLNISLKTLNSPAYILSSCVQKETWIALLAYCVGQENSGHIVGCRDWPARAWRDLCRVDHDVLKKESSLWCWDGNDLGVLFYPTDQEDTMKLRRKVNKENIEKRWSGKTNPNTGKEPDGIPPEIPIVIHKGKEGKEREGKGNGTYATIPSDEEVMEFGKTFAGDLAGGTPPMDADWVIGWLARVNWRANDWPRDWKRAITADWRKDWRTDWRSGRNGSKSKSVLDFKDQVSQLTKLIEKHAANESSAFYDPNHTLEEEAELEGFIRKKAEAEKAIATGK